MRAYRTLRHAQLIGVLTFWARMALVPPHLALLGVRIRPVLTKVVFETTLAFQVLVSPVLPTAIRARLAWLLPSAPEQFTLSVVLVSILLILRIAGAPCRVVSDACRSAVRGLWQRGETVNVRAAGTRTQTWKIL